MLPPPLHPWASPAPGSPGAAPRALQAPRAIRAAGAGSTGGNSTRLSPQRLKSGPSAVSPLPEQMDLFGACKGNECFGGSPRLCVIVLGDSAARP